MSGVRQFDEQETFERSIAVFWRKGYANTSMNDLAEATGVQRGSLYNAYGSKDALFLRAYQVYAERYLMKARESLERRTHRASLESFFNFIIEWLREGEPTRGCLSTKTAFAGEIVEEPIREAVADLLDRLEAVIFERLAKPEETTRMALSPLKAAHLVLTMTRGLVVLERIYPNNPERLRASKDSLLEVLFIK
ncbi:MAG TPA: TetR/AcrR family transcriptional regulator [Burkholderiaceae bacterium]|jgi:AcrR family transcriptional regulator